MPRADMPWPEWLQTQRGVVLPSDLLEELAEAAQRAMASTGQAAATLPFGASPLDFAQILADSSADEEP